MDKQTLEFYLERGDTFGFNTPIENFEILGWVLISKAKVNQRLWNLAVQNENSRIHDEQSIISQKPYVVNVIELRREVYEKGDYLSNNDYLVNKSHFFTDLNEVDNFINSYGLSVENVKWLAEINAP